MVIHKEVEGAEVDSLRVVEVVSGAVKVAQGDMEGILTLTIQILLWIHLPLMNHLSLHPMLYLPPSWKLFTA